MRTLRYLLPLLSVALLHACAHQSPATATVADLAGMPLPVIPAESAADRARAIAGYQEFLRHTEDPILKAEAMRRLADLSLEAAEEKALRGQAPEAATVPAPAVATPTPPPAATPAPPPRSSPNSLAATVANAEPVPQVVPGDSAEKPSDSETARIIALYEERLAAYPYHPQNDQVLYQLSRAYANAGRPEDELRMLDRLVVQYPYSPLLAEAQFRRGEMLFVRKRYPEADLAYRAVLGRGTESGFYEQALYKRAWSLFKQSLYLEGIDYFLALVDRKSHDGRLELERLSRTERETIEDTLRAISLSFAYLEGPDSVTEYFRSRGHRKDEDVLYRALGEEYLKKERFSDAAASFQAFVAAYPNSERSPLFQLRAIQAYREGGFPSQVLEAQKAYVRLYDLRSPFWRGRNPAEHPAVVAQLESSLRDLARHYHAQAQKTKDDGDYAAAGDWYQRYLTNFNTHARAQEMRFLYAELLYEHEQFVAAAEQYSQAAYAYTRNARAAEAAYAAVLSLENHVKHVTDDQRLPWRRQVLAAARRLASEFPQHPQAVPALTYSAQQAFELGDGEAAADAAQQLLTLKPLGPEPRLTALTIIGHTAFDREDFGAAEAAYRDALSLPILTGDKRRRIAERLAASLYKQGEQRREGGDRDGAVAAFLLAAQANPHSSAAEPGIAATAQFDAAAVLIELERWPEAIEALETFRQRFPKHPQQPEVTRRLAAAYLAAGRTEAAAHAYLQVADEAATPELRRAALWQAAELYRQAGLSNAARAGFVRYVEEFPAPLGQRVEATQQLLELALETGDQRAARRWRQAIVDADAKAGPERTERTRFLAAQAVLALAEEPHRAYQRIKLVEPLQTSLRSKQRAFKRTLAAYERAAGYKVAAVTTAASYAIATLYADFAKALLESERPAELKGEALAEYEVLLEEQALPFEDKAIEIHAINAGRAAEGLYDDWIRKSFDALAELAPARYAKTERSDGFVETLY